MNTFFYFKSYQQSFRLLHLNTQNDEEIGTGVEDPISHETRGFLEVLVEFAETGTGILLALPALCHVLT